jgi:hypothetical protein
MDAVVEVQFRHWINLFVRQSDAAIVQTGCKGCIAWHGWSSDKSRTQDSVADRSQGSPTSRHLQFRHLQLVEAILSTSVRHIGIPINHPTVSSYDCMVQTSTLQLGHCIALSPQTSSTIPSAPNTVSTNHTCTFGRPVPCFSLLCFASDAVMLHSMPDKGSFSLSIGY